MAITIGRVGQDIVLSDPFRIDQAQEGIFTLTGLTKTTESNGIFLRNQLNGLGANTDEPIVPVFFGGSYTWHDGLYRVLQVNTPVPPGAGKLGQVAWTMQLERITNHQAPFMESRTVCSIFTNPDALTLAGSYPCVAFPTPANETYSSAGSTGGTSLVINTADGDIYQYGGDATLINAASGYWLCRASTTLANWYVGSVRFLNTSSYYKVVGRQSIDDVTNWILTNGLVQIYPSSSGAGFTLSWWAGAAWESATEFAVFSTTTATTVTSIHHIAVLRNGPEIVVLRLGLANSGGYTLQVDISLRRGQRTVGFLVTGMNFSTTTGTWGIKRTSVDAATAIGIGGIRKTANDAQGNRWCIFVCGAGRTNDLVNGSSRLTTAANSAMLGIGCEVDGSTAIVAHAADAQFRYFASNVNETSRVVSR